MPLPKDYAERVYAGVLGKIIGVYLGRPFEGWTYETIMERLGEITYYVNEKLPWKPPLVVTDDDISGTITFLRALPDYGNMRDLTPAQIGQTWLNYIIENRTILWWGGLGNSSEHTAFLRLKEGIQAPKSGSMALNGKIIAEQIGSQIFIDGWAMVAPGDPGLAADLARRAASVSHDGEGIYGAQVIAAMEALAFVESDIDKLIDCGVSFIPRDSVLYRMIGDIREWHAGEPDWHKTRARIAGHYGYDSYGGNCHIVPNHGMIILGLLYSDDDFQKSMTVVNTAGWDTDCNSGNLGCLMGIKNGLAGLDAGPDWRGPVADRLYNPTADGGRSITDAVIEAYHIVNIGRALAGELPVAPKSGARFHFEFPGSVQGFRTDTQNEGEGVTLGNVEGYSRYGRRTLAVRHQGDAAKVATPTFILPDELGMEGYKLLASPTLYAGQTVKVGLTVDRPSTVKLFIQVYDVEDKFVTVYGPELTPEPDTYTETGWKIPDTGSQPIAEVGLECSGERPGSVYLDYLTWEGEPDVTLTRPTGGENPWDPPQVWRRAWVNGMDLWENWWPEAFRLVQNSGRGLIMQGTREWKDYTVEATVTPTLMDAGGICARVQGLKRFYSLQLVKGGKACLIKVLDGDRVLAEENFDWEIYQSYDLKLKVGGNHITGWVNDRLLFDLVDRDRPLMRGGVAYVVESGHMGSHSMKVRPISIR